MLSGPRGAMGLGASESVLALQGSAGNRAVSALLRQPVRTAMIARQADPPVDDFIMHPSAMDLVEQKLRQLYEELPVADRVKLQGQGRDTVAVGMVTSIREPGSPRLVYTTAGNRASLAFRAAAEKLGLTEWLGDAGVAMERKGPPRQGSPSVNAPVGTGGLVHAEQLMLGYAGDYGYIVHGMAVSRQFCRDCPIVLRRYNGGRLMVSVILDPADLSEARNRPREETPGPRGRTPSRSRPREVRGTGKPSTGPTNPFRAGKGRRVPNRRGGGVKPPPSGGGRGEPLFGGGRGVVVEGRGGTLPPIEEPHLPMNSRKAGHEGLATLILAMQLNWLRKEELGKAMKRLKELGPEIDALQARGLGVTVAALAEVPNTIDLAAKLTGIGDSSQIVLFYDMFIAGGEAPVPNRPAEALDKWEDQRVRDREVPEQAAPKDKHWVQTRARDGYHLQTEFLHLPAPGQAHKDLFRAVAIRSIAHGSRDEVETHGLNRWLFLDGGVPTMADDDSATPWSTDRGKRSIASAMSPTVSARFQRTTWPRYEIDSTFSALDSRHLSNGGAPVLIEAAEGKSALGDSRPWKAEILWAAS